ncbi:protein unc-93 homolog A-like [Antedon mediterranea]|uniref:protein unc-93 homolog A-like n=1 Tax=Antedon mediterranea TaxID=105859 RepID=UPI003AF872A7
MTRPSETPPVTQSTGLHTGRPIVTSSLLPRARRRKTYWKNLFVLSLAFFFVFTAYMSIQNLQSSLNTEEDLGVISLTIVYGSVVFSCIFIAPILIRKFGTKWTMAGSIVMYSVYTACNYYPTYGTLIPSSFLIGLAAAPLWTAQGTYLTTSAISLADLTNEVPETLLNRFNGIFFVIFQSNQVVGNLISSLVLQQTDETSPNNTGYCGRCSCNKASSNSTGDSRQPDKSLVNTLLTVYLVIGIIGLLLVVFFLDTLPTFQSSRMDRRECMQKWLETLGILRNPILVLLVPLMMYSGIEQAFVAGDFTKAYVTCAKGVEWVGYVMICYGGADAVSSYLLGRLEKYTGRLILFSLGGLVQMILIVTMYLWHPKADDDIWKFMLIAAGWGFGDAVWQTQICSIVGVLFPDKQESAFANFRLWQSLGFSVAFACSIPNNVCIHHKLFGFGGWLVMSMVAYYTVEIIVHRTKPGYLEVKVMESDAIG